MASAAVYTVLPVSFVVLTEDVLSPEQT